jgi:hypothetical protein
LPPRVEQLTDFLLLINFVVLLSAVSVLELLLNFAALQFIQTIDNIVLELLAADGFMGDNLKVIAKKVKEAALPRLHEDNWMLSLDTTLFVITFSVLIFVLRAFAL